MRFFAVLLYLKITNPLSEMEMRMITEVVNSFEKPTEVVINACWTKLIYVALRTDDSAILSHALCLTVLGYFTGHDTFNIQTKTTKINVYNKLGMLEDPKMVSSVQESEICDNTSPGEKIIILTDFRCLNSKDTLLAANKCHKFRSPYRWLIVGITSNKHYDIPTVLENINILTDAEVVLSQKNEDKFSLYMPYKIGSMNNEWIVEDFGTWDSKNGLLKSEKMLVSTPIRRKDLLGEPITISVVITDNRTKTELLDMRNIHRDTLAKSNFLHFLPIYDFTNATKVIIYTETWGYLVNGTYNGMVGHVARGEAELAGTIIFITKERLPILEYMNYPASPSVKFVFREPSLSYQHNLFLLPFKPTVWCCIIGLVFVLIFVLFINARWEYVKSSYADKFDHTVLKPNVSDIAILVISAISQQGSSTELKGTLGRVVMFILFLAFVFLYTSYSASIVALLQSSSDRIRTLSDLLNSKLDLGAEDTLYNRHYFATETEPVKKAIYQYKIAPQGSKSNFLKLEDGVRKLQKEPFAFNMNTGLGYRLVEQYFYEHEKCGLREISYFPNTKPWQTCRKNSPYKEIFKIGSFRSQEHGFNVRVNKLVYSKKPLCMTKGGNFGSVNMRDFYPALLTLLYGMILALTILMLEILVHRKSFVIIKYNYSMQYMHK